MTGKYKVGFTAGVFDMFHIGHLNLIQRSKELCNKLIVGVNSDDLVLRYKGKRAIINEQHRLRIVAAIRFVDEAYIMDSLDKLEAWERFEFDVVFIGDDWKGTKRWNRTESDLRKVGVDVVYLPYTKNISSSDLRLLYQNMVSE